MPDRLRQGRKVPPSNARRKPSGQLDPEGMLTSVLNNPGRQDEDIAAA